MSKQKNMKRILSVKVTRECDTDPDTSHLGEYSNHVDSEYAIDRAHSEDCSSVLEEVKTAKETLEHVQQSIGDLHNAVLAQYNGTLANESLDTERDELDEAYNLVGELIDTIGECDCSKHFSGREYRYFNACIEKYKSVPLADMLKYIRQDYDRMESLNNGQWCYLGIRAEACIVIPTPEAKLTTGIHQTITSDGLWGIESDSDKEHLASIEQEELVSLRSQLDALGFSKRAISKAFADIEHVDA